MTNPHPVRSLALLRRTEIDLEKRRLDAFLETYDWLVTLYDEVGQAEGPADMESRGGGALEATPQGSGSSPASETAATVDELMDCYRSGQMQPGEMLARINADPELRRRYFDEVRAFQAKKRAALEEAPTEPQPTAQAEATADPANEGGDHAQVDDDEPKSPAGPVSQDAAPAPTDSVDRGLTHRQQQMLDWLEGEADAEGWIDPVPPAAVMSAATGMPKGSLQAQLEALERKGFVEPRGKGLLPPIRLAEGVRRPRDQETTESREDDGDAPEAPASPPSEAPPQGSEPASETAAPNTREERSGTSRKDSSTHGERDPEGSDVGVQPAAPHAEAPRPEPSRPVSEGPPPKVAFDSKVPRPDWASRDGNIVKAPDFPDRPKHLAVAGAYLICGRHHITLPTQLARIAGLLVASWGQPVPTERLVVELKTKGKLDNKEARNLLKPKHLKNLNERIAPANLEVTASGEAWTLGVRVANAGVAA